MGAEAHHQVCVCMHGCVRWNEVLIPAPHHAAPLAAWWMCPTGCMSRVGRKCFSPESQSAVCSPELVSGYFPTFQILLVCKNLQSGIISARFPSLHSEELVDSSLQSLIRIDLCFMLSHWTKHCAMGYHTAWWSMAWFLPASSAGR